MDGVSRVVTRTGLSMPALGQGTWRMGEDPARRKDEVSALRLGFDLGLALVDTAEMYAAGGAEEVVAEAIRGRREEVVVVSKVLPQNASRRGTVEACERSLARLRTDRVDLYLLHWPSTHPIEGTLAAFESLVEAGKILHYGVSNFDTEDMERFERARGGNRVATNQVLYGLAHRGPERKLLRWCVERGVALMAYSPFDKGALRRGAALAAVARRLGATPLQVALAWTVRLGGVVAIPKSWDSAHVRENALAASVRLGPEDLAEIEREHPAPDRDVPLETA